MFGMLSVFAEFERAMIQERVKAGLARARAKGRRLGRPKVDADELGIIAAVGGGLSVRKTARQFGVSPAKVQRVVAELGLHERSLHARKSSVCWVENTEREWRWGTARNLGILSLVRR
jgi:DNA invertase Pin-like site-specific DNA recombinase